MSIKKIITSSILGAYLALSPMAAQAETQVTHGPVEKVVRTYINQGEKCDYDGNGAKDDGICINTNLGGILKFGTPVVNKCLHTSKQVQCYNKKDIETVVNGWKSTSLTDVEKQVMGMISRQCSEEMSELDKLMELYETAQTNHKTAETNLSDFEKAHDQCNGIYTDHPSNAHCNTRITPLMLFEEDQEGRDLKEQYDGLIKKVTDTKKIVDETKFDYDKKSKFIDEHGCNYVAPVVPVKKSVDVTPSLRGVVDTDGNFGGEIELDITYPVSDNWNLGGYLNGSFLNHADENSYGNDLGMTTEEISESKDLWRYMGAGAMVGYDLTSWLTLQSKIGAAWMHEDSSKDITRFGETGTLTSSENKVVGEGSLGVQFKPYKCLTIDVEARGNTNPGLDAIIGLGYKF